jgi:serine/threonine-protein kinase
LAAGQRIGPFVLLAPLGSGGSGRIWAVARVGQLGFSKRMVLKVMRNDKLSSERARERFDREACLGGRLSHPNVRAVHDLGSHEGRPFMALSWVDASLEELLEHAPGHALDADVACWIAMQCCSALSAAHEYVDHGGVARPIVHRDVSPGNILLTADGHALLADLTAPAAEASPRAEAGTRFFGSLGYAAPEALRLEPCDARADLFSLGAVLFEALAGTPAFGGDDERSVMFQILEGPPLDLARRAPNVPADLAAVVQRCLERRAESRFQSARELREALARCSAQRSAFSLEQRAARSVRDVLGARIREREEALHLAYQRIAPSPFEHTDTLPIQGAGAASASQRAIDPSSPGLDLSRSAAGMALSEPRPRRGRRTLWVAAALAILLGLYGSLSSRRRSVSSTGAASAAGSEARAPSKPPPASEPTTAALDDPPPSIEAAPLLPLAKQNVSKADPAPASADPPPSRPKAAQTKDARAPKGSGQRAPASRTPRATSEAEPTPQPSGAPGLDRESPYGHGKSSAPVRAATEHGG